jgi:hypothetical protein
MTDPSKIKTSHLQRAAYVYIRQSTPGQVEHNRESTVRQNSSKALHQEPPVLLRRDGGSGLPSANQPSG